MCPFPYIGISIDHSFIILASIWIKKEKKKVCLEFITLGNPTHHSKEDLAKKFVSLHAERRK